MRHIRHLLAPLVALALLAAALSPAPARASRAVVGPAASPARHSRYTMIYGYLTDSKPATDSTLYVYSKTHKTTYHVEMMNSTVVKVHTQVVHRAQLSSGMYVIISCNRLSNGTLQAVTVHVELHRKPLHT